ncbi:PEP-CTERM sorting domain-containing protein [Gemmata sp.]|uniref:PEP-CTERM sorting domain-containing protein n=1 Tax=Gemmata sp. TaxID=1914242 RepID=UPI003F6E5370
MRRLPAWTVAVVLGSSALAPQCAAAADGFWVSLASGVGDAPTEYAEFSFDSPHAPIVINQLTGTGPGRIVTGGGTTFYTGPSSPPILVPTSDGYATITPGETVPAGAPPRFAGGTPASGAPLAGSSPEGANLASVSLTDGENGSKVLTVGVTDANGNPLGQGSISVGPDGWWVIGLGTAALDGEEPPPVIEEPPPPPPVDPVPPPTPDNGPVATPEPASAVLLGVGGLFAAGFRRLRRK